MIPGVAKWAQINLIGCNVKEQPLGGWQKRFKQNHKKIVKILNCKKGSKLRNTSANAEIANAKIACSL